MPLIENITYTSPRTVMALAEMGCIRRATVLTAERRNGPFNLTFTDGERRQGEPRGHDTRKETIEPSYGQQSVCVLSVTLDKFTVRMTLG